MHDIVVVGAGVAGLTAGALLSRAGSRVTVLEREPSVGGLARTFTYGGYRFDIGPHRFHTDDAAVLAFIRQTLAGNSLEIDRRSGVWMFGRYHDWPLRSSSMFRLPLRVLLGAAGDLVRRRHADTTGFRDYITAMYGRTIYELFFAPYTRKFIVEEPERIHADWAISGVDRAVIDKRVRMNTLSQVIKGAFLPRPVRTKFIYPAAGGIGAFAEGLRALIEGCGGRVLTGHAVTGVRTEGSLVVAVRTKAGAGFRADLVIWTAPVTGLWQMLDRGPTSLSFVSTLCYNYEVGGSPRIPYQWCYFGQEDIVYSRVSIPSFFSPGTAPDGGYGLCVEVTCNEGDDRWEHPERLTAAIEAQLFSTGVLRTGDGLSAPHIEHIRDTYPVYRLDYQEEMVRVRQGLGSIRNLRLLGRSGTYWYNNMDHSVRMALDLAGEIAQDVG